MLSLGVHLLLLVVAATADGSSKLKYLKGKMKDGLVDFGEKAFQKYAAESPRPYHMVLFFTAQNAKFNCEVCQ